MHNCTFFTTDCGLWNLLRSLFHTHILRYGTDYGHVFTCPFFTTDLGTGCNDMRIDQHPITVHLHWAQQWLAACKLDNSLKTLCLHFRPGTHWTMIFWTTTRSCFYWVSLFSLWSALHHTSNHSKTSYHSQIQPIRLILRKLKIKNQQKLRIWAILFKEYLKKSKFKSVTVSASQHLSYSLQATNPKSNAHN